MPVPKKRHSRSRQGSRRAHFKISPLNLGECPTCHAPVLPHHVCPACHTYQGRTVMEIKEKKEKKGK